MRGWCIVINKKAGIMIVAGILSLGAFFIWQGGFFYKGGSNIQEGQDVLLSTDESTQLLKRIEGILGESNGKNKIFDPRTNKLALGHEEAGNHKRDDQVNKSQSSSENSAHHDQGQIDKLATEEGVVEQTRRQVVSKARESGNIGKLSQRKDSSNGNKSRINNNLSKSGRAGGWASWLSRFNLPGSDNSKSDNNSNTESNNYSHSNPKNYTFTAMPFSFNDPIQSNDDDEDYKDGNAPVDQGNKEKEYPLTPTPWSIEFHGRVNAEEGSWVLAYNSSGTLCGKSSVKKDGKYGVLHVYMDDSGTKEIEGMRVGEVIIFKVDGKGAKVLGPDEGIFKGQMGDLKQVDLDVDSSREEIES